MEMDKSPDLSQQQLSSSSFSGKVIVMAACNRVVAALNFLTGEGIDYYPDNCNEKDIGIYPDNCNKKDIGVLISNYFENGNDEESDCESADESNKRMKMLKCLN